MYLNALLDGGYNSEEEADAIVNNIGSASEHPDGTDILFYPAEGVENSPEGFIKAIKEWRTAKGKPAFKPV